MQTRLGVARGAGAVIFAATLICATRVSAVNIVLDYSYDTNNFFPVGSQARTALQAAATFYTSILTDTLSAIVEPPDYAGPMGGTAHFDWSISFSHPSGSGTVIIDHPTIAADEYRVYVGSRDIDGSTLGVGGPGGNNPAYGYSAFPSEVPQIEQIYNNFVATITKRGEATGFANWGGALSFDRVGTAWHFNHTTTPAAGTNDFYSVAIHELGHALGFGASPQWENLAGGSAFTGAAAAAAYGSSPPLYLNPQTGQRDHWAPGTMSKILGTNTPQEAAMDPEITLGTRKRLTSLDAAALVDIGWSVAEPPPLFLPADFNQDGTVNGPDLTTWRSAFRTTAAGNADGDGDSDGNDFLIWQRTLGSHSAGAASGNVPEPGSATLASISALSLAAARRRSVRATHRPSRAFD